jgi:hypothetical protein
MTRILLAVHRRHVAGARFLDRSAPRIWSLLIGIVLGVINIVIGALLLGSPLMAGRRDIPAT